MPHDPAVPAWTRRLSRLWRIGFPFSILILVAALLGARLAATPNAIQTENAKTGTTSWQLTNHGYASGVIEGYASLTSVNVGGQISLFVNTREPSYTIDIYRMGYYGGAGGRRVLATITRTGRMQQIPAPDPTTGLIECNWVDPYVLNIPSDWVSGVYLAKLTASSTGTQQYIVFTVRDDNRASDFLLAQTVSTYQAYNPWGGKSLYGTLQNRGDTANAAFKVSFNRPYYGEEGEGASSFFNWEYGMIQWLESRGYDVTYATSVDIDRDPGQLSLHRGFLSVGHDEYWSWNMRNNVEQARDRGVHLRFFSGNVSYWQVRFEPSPATGAASRTLVGYKEHWQQDPITPDYLKTNEFRYAPVNRSEDQMAGVMFVTQAKPPCFIVEDAQNWIFAGSGLRNGDCVKNGDGSSFLGYEVDSMGPLSPAITRRLAHSPVNAAGTDYSDMVFYRAASGATVVSTGSIGWSQGIPSIVQITANVLDCVVANTCADWIPARTAPPSGFSATDIGDPGRAGFVALATPSSVSLNGAGHGLWSGADALYFVYGTLPGDGQIVVRLTSLRLYWDNRAGVMIRESLSPGSKYVALAARPSGSVGAVNEGVELLRREQTSATPRFVASRDMPMPNWLKLTRVSGVVDAQVSADNSTWTSLGTSTVPMSGTSVIGVYVTSSQPGVWATANVDNLSVNGTTAAAPPAPAPGSLPAGWQSQDVGATGVAGASSASNGQFLIKGAGADIWGTADAFQYAYRSFSGDTQIIARLVGEQNTNTYAKAGLMFRESPAADARHVILDVRPGGSLEFMTRSATSGATQYLGGGTMSAPGWLKLAKSGATVTGSVSPDGSTWTPIGSTSFSASTGAVGLAVTSHDTSQLNASTFDSVSVTTPSQPSQEITIYASDVPAGSLHGAWTKAADATSPNGTKLATADAGIAVTDQPLASPAHYFDVTFPAAAGTPYTLWLRMKALNNSKYNDSVWVQFSDATAAGSPAYAIGSASGLLVNLATDGTATSLNGWGWQNGAYWLQQPGTVTFTSSGTHTLRVQVREDGVQIDQIVLSANRYLRSAPGAVSNDATIVGK